MITAYVSGSKISSNSEEAFSMHEKSRFGEKKDGKVEYSAVEALFLVSVKKMKAFLGKREVDLDFLMRKFKKDDKRIEIKFPVFSDLRKKGYVVKTALKFGAEFRVYKKGVRPGEDHALWILYPVKETESHSWYDFAAKNRVAHSAKKKLLIGVVDEEEDVSYYEVGWIRP
jgi:tRNA-intron endonuclease, archaea type